MTLRTVLSLGASLRARLDASDVFTCYLPPDLVLITRGLGDLCLIPACCLFRIKVKHDTRRLNVVTRPFSNEFTELYLNSQVVDKVYLF